MEERGLLRGHGSKGIETVRTSLTLERHQSERIEVIAAKKGVSVAWVIRAALDQYLTVEERRMSSHIDGLRAAEVKQRGGPIALFFNKYCGFNVADDYDAQVFILVSYRATLHSARVEEELKRAGYASTMRHLLKKEDGAMKANLDAILERALPLCNVGRFPAVADMLLATTPAADTDGKATLKVIEEFAHALPQFAIGEGTTYDVDGPAATWLKNPVVRDKLYQAIFTS